MGSISVENFEDIQFKYIVDTTCSAKILIDSLVGIPRYMHKEIKEVNGDYLNSITAMLVENACFKTALPEILSMNYDDETKYWTIMFYGTDVIVKAAVKGNDEDGEPIIDYKVIGLN